MNNKLMITVIAAVLSLIIATFALAQSYDIKVMTPEIKAALDNRRARFSELAALKKQGLIGENNRGYIEVLSNDSNADEIVNAENQDREVIYKAIAEQNNLIGARETIEAAFAQVQRDKAQAGDKIQKEDGEWVTK